PRREQPLEPWEGPQLGAPPARARLRGSVRPHAGYAFPPRRAVPALAPRQAPAGLPLRPAGGHAGLRALARLRRPRSSRRRLRASPGIVIGVGRLLGGALLLRHVAEVDPDAGPRSRAPAHRVDQDVVDREPRRRRRMARLPGLETGEGIRLVRGLRDGDEG